MKIKVVEPKRFRPIEMTITIESLDEAKELWHRLNTPWNTVTKEGNPMEKESSYCWELWSEIDKKINPDHYRYND